MTQAIKHIPKIRFPEFKGEWQTSSLGEYFSFKNGINAEKEAYGSGRKFINVMDIVSDLPLTYESIIGKVEVSDAEFKKNKVNYGDILFQRSSETREEVGQSNVYIDESQPATFGGFVIRGRPIKKQEPLYMHFILKTAKVRKDLTARSGGSTRYNVGQASLSGVKIQLASSLPEQQKIATFLTTVDQKIEKLQRKKDLLTDYKKGMMQQLFSQQIRFKDDQGNDFSEWEEKKLGELTDISSSKRVLQEDWKEFGIPFYRTREIISLSKNNPFKSPIYISEDLFFKLKSEYGAPDTGDILVTGVGTIGQTYIVQKSDKFYFKDGNVLWIKKSKEVNSEFLDQQFNTRFIRKQLSDNASITTVATFTIEGARKTRISLPHPDEQKKIANYLTSLDQKIELTNQKLTQAQNFKKGLLQQMFV